MFYIMFGNELSEVVYLLSVGSELQDAIASEFKLGFGLKRKFKKKKKS